MDAPDTKRHKKSDKAKEKHDRNGGFSSKHVRMAEALREKKGAKPKDSSQKKGKL